MKHFRTPPTPTPDSDWDDEDDFGFDDLDDFMTLREIELDRQDSEADRRYQQSREEGP